MTTQEQPICVTLEEGKKYYWCSCGLTAQEPFCDGSHKAREGKRSLPFFVETTKTVSLCQCKKTKTPPYCDGSHNLS